MRRLLMALMAMTVIGCEGQSSGDASGQEGEPVANEAAIGLTDRELSDLKRRGDSGDLQAIRELVNYFRINVGDTSEDTIYWELQAARRGDCVLWNDLMFGLEDGRGVPEGFTVPERLLREGETLKSIGETVGCPPYVPAE
jgi:hypothetical protein